MKAIPYTLFHLVYSAFVGIIAWLLLKNEFSGFSLMLIAAAMALSSILSLASYLLILNSLQGRPTAFIQGVMISMMLKMFSGITSIFLVSWKFKELSVPFAISFMLGYFIFTIPEVIFLNRFARKA